MINKKDVKKAAIAHGKLCHVNNAMIEYSIKARDKI